MTSSIKAIFLDAAGTLMQVAEPVGQTYMRICAARGIVGTAEAFEKGFRLAWKQHAPPFHPPRERSADDDKGWWFALFCGAVKYSACDTSDDQALGAAFDEAYRYFGTGSAWVLYPEVASCLEELAARRPLWVLSNFDRRLHGVLEDLGIRQHFQGVILSSEVGASKPHVRMFEAALNLARSQPSECLHIGDEEEADGEGARAAGLQVLILKRPEVTLTAALTKLGE